MTILKQMRLASLGLLAVGQAHAAEIEPNRFTILTHYEEVAAFQKQTKQTGRPSGRGDCYFSVLDAKENLIVSGEIIPRTSIIIESSNGQELLIVGEGGESTLYHYPAIKNMPYTYPEHPASKPDITHGYLSDPLKIKAIIWDRCMAQPS